MIDTEGGVMDQYDTTAESLRAKVQQLAEQISQLQAKRGAAVAEPFFIDDIFHAVENAAGDVANIVGDAVSAAVNATHDAINAVENVGKDVINATDDAIHATENIIHAVTDHTDVIHNIANVTLEAIHITPEIADFIGFTPAVDTQDKATAASQAAARASAVQLLQARRALLREKSKSLSARTTAKRAEIKEKIEAVRDSIAAAKRRSPG
jgi:phage-related protein